MNFNCTIYFFWNIISAGVSDIQQYYENKAQSDPNKELQMKFNVTDVSDAADYVIVDGDFRVSRKEHELDHGKYNCNVYTLFCGNKLRRNIFRFLLVLKKVDDSFQVFRIMMNTNRGTAVHGDQKCGADAPHHDAPHQDW